MRFAIRFADKLVGLFVLVAIIGLLGVIIVLGANQRWFAKNYYFYTFFQSGKGISRGMPITFKGFEIGKVSSVEMNDKNEVVVHYYIYDTYYSKVKLNSVIELASSPLGSSLLFYPGRSESAPLRDGQAIPSVDSAQGKTITAFNLAELPEQSEDTISAIIKNVDEITFQVNTFFKNNAEELDQIVQSLSTTTVALARALEGDTSGPLGQMLTGLAGTVGNLEKLTSDIDGLIPRLLDPTGETIFPMIVTILQNIETMSIELQRFASFISGTAPQIAGLLEQGRETLDKGKDVLEGLSNNPLIRGGITREREQPTTLRSFRDEAF